MCHLHSHLVGILWFVPDQQCSPHEVVHDFMLKCRFNVSGTGVVCSDPHSLFQQRVLAELFVLLLCQILGFLLESRNVLCWQSRLWRTISTLPQNLNCFFHWNPVWWILSFCAVGEILQVIIAGICFLLCQPGLLSILLCQGFVGTAAEPQWDMSQFLVTHNLIFYLSAVFRGGRRVFSCFFFSKMKRLIVCQCNYAVVPAWIPCSQHSVQFQTGSLHQNVSVCAWFHWSCQIWPQIFKVVRQEWAP